MTITTIVAPPMANRLAAKPEKKRRHDNAANGGKNEHDVRHAPRRWQIGRWSQFDTVIVTHPIDAIRLQGGEGSI